MTTRLRPRGRLAHGALLAFAITTFIVQPASAHGVAGNRFFPATLATEDPFAADELSLPTLTRFKTADTPSSLTTDVSAEYSKRLTSRMSLSVGERWSQQKAPGEAAVSGFQNLETGLKYQLVTNPAHEAIVSLGLGAEWGGTGSKRVGAEAISTISPTLYFGKGAGDLPESFALLQPFAVTGAFSYAIPTQGRQTVSTLDLATGLPVTSREATSSVLHAGFALEYSLPYLAAHVRDLGLPTWVNHLTPLVEVALDRPLTHDRGVGTTGTINPGVIWSARHFQLAAEGVIPINRLSGPSVGVIVQVHIFLDDLFPHSIGRPIW